MRRSIPLLLAFISSAAHAHVEEVEVTGRRANLVGEAVSASQGKVGQEEIQARPILRVGEVLETVPGMVVTQHSGSGKANQFFLRGFNLDHGTDFRTAYDGMPVNMRSHGHGQGYTDLNFIIPELVKSIEYKKGPYYAEVGDFSGAGSASFTTMDTLDRTVIELGAGKDGFGRLLAAGSTDVGNGDLLLAADAQVYDGPWKDINEDVRRISVLGRYGWDAGENRFSVTLMAYRNEWNSADQIPQRAVDQGLIDRLGSIDTTVGGESSRYSLSGSWENPNWQANAYAIRYSLDLWSNFTYLLDNPVDGDQFEQVDRRWIYGGELKRLDTFEFDSLDYSNTVGLQLRADDIGEVGLYNTVARERIGTVRKDEIQQNSAALFWNGEFRWAARWRANLGLRYDQYWFDVDSNLAANSGKDSAGIASYKFNLSYQVASQWELYAGAGTGFHSNDARGVTISIDPATGDAVDNVDPLVRSKGAELGARFFATDKLNVSMALWGLDLDSELVFVGDAGNTEASRSSRRYGVELTAYWWLSESWTLDAEVSRTHSRFTEDDPSDPALGDSIPGAIPTVFAAGVSYTHPHGYFGSARVRYFGPRPLEENGDVKSDSSTVVNLRAGYRWDHWQLSADILNVFNSKDHDIDYYYASRLEGEPADGIEDIHFHPVEPRTFRVYLRYSF